MNATFRIRLLLVVAVCLGVCPLWAEGMLEKEALGSLKLGQGADVVISSLGKPGNKGKEELSEASGEWVQEWDFPAQGIVLSMSSEKKGGGKTVSSITAKAPCKLATSRGIGIGSTEAEVAKAYREVRDKEDSEAGKLFVAGSLYGGVSFTIEGGKVVQVFVGASAE